MDGNRTISDHPPKLAVDAEGYCWRVFDDGTWSMARTNPDNSPIPKPVTYYEPSHKSDLEVHEEGLLTVRYVAPPSGVMEALEGWAVEVRTKDGVTAQGVFQGDVPHKGMFRIVDDQDDHIILGTDIENVREVIVL